MYSSHFWSVELTSGSWRCRLIGTRYISSVTLMSDPHLAARLHGARLKVFDNLHKSLVDVDKVGECIRVAGVPGGEL